MSFSHSVLGKYLSIISLETVFWAKELFQFGKISSVKAQGVPQLARLNKNSVTGIFEPTPYWMLPIFP